MPAATGYRVTPAEFQRAMVADLDGRAGRVGAPASLSVAELAQVLRLADPRGGGLVDVPRFVGRCRYLPSCTGNWTWRS